MSLSFFVKVVILPFLPFCALFVGLSHAVAMASKENFSWPAAVGNFPHLLPGYGMGE
jgi:hypothetical protein